MCPDNCPSDLTVSKALQKFFGQSLAIDALNGDGAIIAVSGGPDSMALLRALFEFYPKINWYVVTIDHGLRTTSKDEAQFVGAFVTQWNKVYATSYTHEIIEWVGEKPRSGLLEAARRARYDLLCDFAQKNNLNHVFVAHHLDDQAETFLMRLAKGSGLDGLAGIKAVQNYQNKIKLCRPLLDVPKADLLAYCEAYEMKFVQDPTNENEDYLRPRLRKSMAVLEEEGLTASRLGSLTKRLTRARRALQEISETSYDEALRQKDLQKIILDFKTLKNVPEEIAFRVVVRATKELRDSGGYGIRMEKLETLFESLYYHENNFKPRTLGGLLFALKDKNTALYISKEK